LGSRHQADFAIDAMLRIGTSLAPGCRQSLKKLLSGESLPGGVGPSEIIVKKRPKNDFVALAQGLNKIMVGFEQFRLARGGGHSGQLQDHGSAIQHANGTDTHKSFFHRSLLEPWF
jgi:hypothetical protein